GNGLDCTKTIRVIGHHVIGSECTKCSFLCGFYKKWIDNQKEEFLKQKQKYDKEISGNSRKKRSPSNKNYKGYDEEFYDEFKSNNVGGLDKFLEKLSNEEICTKITEKEGEIDFKTVKSSSTSGDGGGASDSNNSNKTFSHSKYCEECPECGVEEKTFEEKPKTKSGECDGKKLYDIPIGTNHNVIPFLSFGDEHKEIIKKIEQFCGKSNSDSSELTEKWKCYEFKQLEKVGGGEVDVKLKDAGGLCILEKTNGTEKVNKQKTFNDFFHFWVRHLLNDSIEWREKFGKCLKNGKKTCKNNEKCNRECGCFLKWVNEKKTEWHEIKKHFDTQDFDKGAAFGAFTPYLTLELVLELEYFPLIQEAYGDAQAIQGINKTLEKKKKEPDADTSKDKTIIDYLLDHEKKDATKCKQKQDECERQKQKESLGRAATDPQAPATPSQTNGTPASEDEDEDEDEEHDAEGDVDDHHEEGEDEKDTVDGQSETPTTTTQDGVKPACEIVDKLFSNRDNTFKDACDLKYNKGKHYGWKCVPTSGDEKATSGSDKTDTNSDAKRHKRAAPGGDQKTTTTPSNSGATCIPPRRRRLYVTPLTTWASDEATKAGSQETSADQKAPSETSSPSDGKTASQNDGKPGASTTATTNELPEASIRRAFVESAAVETFFLWHKFKAENTKKPEKKKDQSELQGGVSLFPELEDEEDTAIEPDPEEELRGGTIPDGFLRQMFYTLGDYRDICIGKTPHGIDTVSASGDNPTNEVTMKKISEKIQKILNGGNNQESGSTQTQPNSDKRQTWWNNNAKDIWNAMVYALTYKDNSDTQAKKSDGTTNITQDNDLKKELLESDGKKPKDTYKYDKVVLKEDKNSVPKSTTTTQSPTLKNFVVRPPYFRYLEEWGQNFCKERKKRLAQIYKECKIGDDKYKCSGFGEDCKNNLLNKSYDTVPSLECPDCARHCSFYKKWIKIKKDEFTEQQNAFTKQKKKYEEESKAALRNNDGNGVCGTVKTCETAAEFLKRLKNGPCKKDNASGEDKRENSHINFGNIEETFGHETYCDPCSEFKIDCEKGNCKNGGGGTNDMCNGKNSITAKDIKKEGGLAEDIGMLVSDKSGKEFEGNGLKDCEGKGIFTGIRKDQWKCGYKCGYNVCEPVKVDGKANGEKHIITIRALVTHWIQYFLEDYNRIKKKLKPCTKNDLESTCQNKCQNKCKCVGEWITKKRAEWESVKKRFNEQYKNADESYPVKTILEEFKDRPVLDKAIKPCDFDNFKTSCGLNDAEKSKKKGDTPKDIVECLFQKLQQKAKKCKEDQKPSGEKQAICEESPSVEDDDEEPEDILLEETEENTVEAPKICGDVIQKTPKEKKEGGCDPAPDTKSDQNPEEKPVLKPEEEAPAPPVAPPATPNHQPLPSDNTSDILKTTIPFGIALALTSIALLFLK
ncbi:hypothetical protein PFMC_05967, partial [Plasmodium falciparum CAMP/Malaysia]